MQVLKEFCGGNGIDQDYDLTKKFNKVHGYELTLQFARDYNDSIYEIRAIQETIDTLEDWKKESWFKLHETTWEIDFFGCTRHKKVNQPKRVTLPKAKQMLKESLIRHETLSSIFKYIKETFGKDDDKYLEEYFNVDEEE